MRGTVLLLAAGEGVRMLAHKPKAFLEVAGVSLLRRSADGAAAAELVDALVVAVPPGDEALADELLDGLAKPFVVVGGGPTRQSSAANAFVRASAAEAIAVHDAARALCKPEMFDFCLGKLDEYEAVLPVVPIADTIKEVADGTVVRTVDRSTLVAAQTPQTFRADVYRRAHEAALRDQIVETDDAAMAERIGIAVHVVVGDPANIKITRPPHLDVAQAMLRS